MKLSTTLIRSCRLRCPKCGKGRFARSWIATHENCSECELDFRVDWGFYLGSIYVSYGATGAILAVVCVPIIVGQYVPTNTLMPFALGFCALFPIWFWRYARSVWFGINYYMDQTRHERKTRHALQSTHQTDHAVATTPHFQSICPHCYVVNEYPITMRGTWSNCKNCGETVLLLPTNSSSETASAKN